MRLLALTLGAALMALAPGASQHQTHRQSSLMGFDQVATTHHFYLSESGGSIHVSVNDPADATNLAGIRDVSSRTDA